MNSKLRIPLCWKVLTLFDVGTGGRWAGIVLLAGALSGIVFMLWVVWRQPSLAMSVLSRLPFIGGRAIVGRLHDFETTAYTFVRQHPRALGIVALCEITFHVVSWLEAWLTLYFITGGSLPIEAFVLDALNRVINIVFKIIPFRIGVDQLGASRLADLINVGAHVGTTMSLVRTVRLVVWSAVGLLLLAGRTAGASRERRSAL